MIESGAITSESLLTDFFFASNTLSKIYYLVCFKEVYSRGFTVAFIFLAHKISENNLRLLHALSSSAMISSQNSCIRLKTSCLRSDIVEG